MGEPLHRDRTLGALRRLYERFETNAETVGAPGCAARKRFAEDAEVLKDAIHYLGSDQHLEKNRALQRTADPTANALIEAMLPQLLIVFARRLGGTVRVPADEVDATGGFNLALKLDGRDFVFVVGRKA